MTCDDDIQVLVVGAGLGGLSLAGLLQRGGLSPVVVDRETPGGPRGPVELWPECTELLTDLGVWDDVRADGAAVTTWSRRRPDGTVAARRTANEFGFVAIEYARLRARLLDAVGEEAVHTGMALRSLTRRRHGVAVEFDNGVREQFDVVVGADGVHSRTRALLDGDEPSFCGTTSVAFSIDGAGGLDGAVDVWTDDGAVLRVTPCGDRAAGWLTVPTNVPGHGWSDGTTLAELCPEIEWLLPDIGTAIGRDEVRWVDDFSVRSDRRAEGRVALLGDAAHRCHRVTGIGALRALEDAATLAGALLERDDPPAARLADYATRRESRLERTGRSVDPEAPLGVGSELTTRDRSVPATRGSRLASCFESEPP